MSVQPPNEVITPTERDSEMALTSSQNMAPIMDGHKARNAHFQLTTKDGTASDIALPDAAVRILFTALQELSQGHSVTVLPVDTELTTQQASKLMRISRPSLIKMLDERKLPFRKVGAHRRVRYDDVMHFLALERARRRKVMEELVAETEKLGLYE